MTNPPVAPRANGEAINELREIGRRAKAFMDRLPSDSPLRGAAFSLCALTGEIEAVASASAPPGRSAKAENTMAKNRCAETSENPQAGPDHCWHWRSESELWECCHCTLAITGDEYCARHRAAQPEEASDAAHLG